MFQVYLILKWRMHIVLHISSFLKILKACFICFLRAKMWFVVFFFNMVKLLFSLSIIFYTIWWYRFRNNIYLRFRKCCFLFCFGSGYFTFWYTWINSFLNPHLHSKCPFEYTLRNSYNIKLPATSCIEQISIYGHSV